MNNYHNDFMCLLKILRVYKKRNNNNRLWIVAKDYKKNLNE